MLGCFTELIDAVILTGGLAYSKMLTDMVIGYLHEPGPGGGHPGENEMEALALALCVSSTARNRCILSAPSALCRFDNNSLRSYRIIA